MYPPGCSQRDIDLSCNGDGEPILEIDELITLDCGCTGTFRNAIHVRGQLVCEDHANAMPSFEGMEVSVLVEALKFYGPSRMGNHTLYDVLMAKLEQLRSGCYRTQSVRNGPPIMIWSE